MPRLQSAILGPLLAAVLAVAPAAAADPALEAAVDMAGMQMFLSSGAPALILVAVSRGETVVRGWGETAPGSGIEPDARAIFRIGSVSKVFATDVLASMAADGTLRLADTLAAHAPRGRAVMAHPAGPITLLDLATHSAGLPREMPDPAHAPQSEADNPFDAYRRDYFWNWIGENAPAYAPGRATIYSNFGYALLGDALAEAGGKPYVELLAERITGPLGLDDTVAALDSEQRKRLMTGLGPFGKPDPNFPAPPEMAPGGGLYSTGHDMARWLGWHLRHDAQARGAMAMSHALWLPLDGLDAAVGTEAGHAAGMGLGWVVGARDGAVPYNLGKSGGLGGFMSYAMLLPKDDLAIFFNVSRVDFSMFGALHESVRELAAELRP